MSEQAIMPVGAPPETIKKVCVIGAGVMGAAHAGWRGALRSACPIPHPYCRSNVNRARLARQLSGSMVARLEAGSSQLRVYSCVAGRLVRTYVPPPCAKWVCRNSVNYYEITGRLLLFII